MLKLVLIAFLPFLLFFGDTDTQTAPKGDGANTGTLKKMIPDAGSVTFAVDMAKVGGRGADSAAYSSNISKDSFLPILIFNNELRGPLPGSVVLQTSKPSAQLPARMREAFSHMTLEVAPWGSEYELTIRDSVTGTSLFNVEGQQYAYDPESDKFTISGGRLLMTSELAAMLGKKQSLETVGAVSAAFDLRAIEITDMIDGEIQRDTLPGSTEAGSRPGPDVVVGDLSGLAQFGSSANNQVGLSVGTDSCNFGVVDLNWFANPSNDHPTIPQNLYRMSGGATNNRTFEQIGQSSVKHAFTALANNICTLGCNGVSGTHLGSGCSDPYSASLNSDQTRLGSRAWINPFTGFYPRNDSATPNNSHTGHTHTGVSHRIIVDIPDLNTSLNAGATYYAEGQYVTPHEYVWCQANPTQCNMNNNVSYRRYNVSGTTSPFSFSAAAATVREQAAINAWTGSSQSKIQPSAATDGVGTLAYKVTEDLGNGTWHYEYAVYNQNLDRAIQSLAMPVGDPVTITNQGFHAPPQHPAWALDGTLNNQGYSSAPWPWTRSNGVFGWATETLAQNQNANAIRWGTMYNFRFDANAAPVTRNVTIGFFKTGAPIVVSASVPTAFVTVSGRVMAGDRGVTNARVSLDDGQGTIRAAITDRNGYYHFTNVMTASTYSLTAVQRRFTFAPQTITVMDVVSNADFAAAM